jgi:hypothetical protein
MMSLRAFNALTAPPAFPYPLDTAEPAPIAAAATATVTSTPSATATPTPPPSAPSASPTAPSASPTAASSRQRRVTFSKGGTSITLPLKSPPSYIGAAIKMHKLGHAVSAQNYPLTPSLRPSRFSTHARQHKDPPYFNVLGLPIFNTNTVRTIVDKRYHGFYARARTCPPASITVGGTLRPRLTSTRILRFTKAHSGVQTDPRCSYASIVRNQPRS